MRSSPWLCEAATAVTDTQADEREHLNPQLLTELRARYDHAVGWGITTNRHRTWAKGNHPGYTLARRESLSPHAAGVWGACIDSSPRRVDSVTRLAG